MKYIDRLIDAILNYIKKFLSYKFYLIKMEVSYLIYKFFNKIILKISFQQWIYRDIREHRFKNVN